MSRKPRRSAPCQTRPGAFATGAGVQEFAGVCAHPFVGAITVSASSTMNRDVSGRTVSSTRRQRGREALGWPGFLAPSSALIQPISG